jgi:hypothetical protein
MVRNATLLKSGETLFCDESATGDDALGADCWTYRRPILSYLILSPDRPAIGHTR